ncbi:MAG: hypothetical protein AAFP19_20290 [Bacteroidota bacterium]
MNSTNPLLWQALQNVISGASGGQQDPIRNVYTNDTTVIDHENIFGFLQSGNNNQGTINRDNINNAASLYAIMVIGDEMGTFKAVDVLLRYITEGRIDVASTNTSAAVYNYMKLSDERTTVEERNMFYRQVFDLGQGQTLQNMAVNRGFGALWETLMEEVIRYVRIYERADNPGNVSKSSINQVMLDLQHNLSRATAGMVKVFIPEMYAHLENAIQILDAPEIKDQVGFGVARDWYTVVEGICREESGHYPNTSALRTIAASARQIILQIADFSPATFSDADFQFFVRTVEAFIVGRSQIEEGHSHYYETEEEEEVDEVDYETSEEDWDF